jgi:hypothetical protein
VNESTIDTASWRELNRRLAADLQNGDGDIKPVRVIEKKANPAKVCIGWFQRRLIRGEFKKGRR